MTYKDVLISEFSFNVEYSQYELVIPQGYCYLSILTDGAINPEANNLLATNIPRLLIKFNDDDIILIRDEIRNYFLRKKRVMYFTNMANTIISSVLSNGYGKLYIVLSKDPVFEQFFKKENPFWCNVVTIPATEAREYIFGAFNVFAGVLMGIPYIPMGYGRIRVNSRSDVMTDTRQAFDEYFYCTNAVATSIFSVMALNVLGSYDIYSNKYKLLLRNDHLSAAKTFYSQITWLKDQQ